MIIEMLIISVLTIMILLVLKALKHDSKNCEFNLEINIKGFKFSFKTIEKDKIKEENAPSIRKR
ncbi:hypothetical protein [uncultured Clostridium sp.]|uniref:hypothetical protein n=1 Tax=uncultured Clostridium sp. TaxID=59620 RepID=UPI0025F58952|nr:hypothetical protein [uncultured Clostridium sp.]